MKGKDFKMIRRNSLQSEVDGVWPGLEEEEDTYTPHKVLMKECMMLRRVLGADKADVLPRACRMNATSQVGKDLSKAALIFPPAQLTHPPTLPTQANKSFMNRLSHLNETSDVAGRVNINECHTLSDSLKMVAGGITFLPASCNAMLNKEEHDLR